MRRIVFLLEEYSMKVLLEGLLPRWFPGLDFLCVPHEGKQDLEKSIPRKLQAWREPGVRFVVLRDNDGADCRALKDRLVELCRAAGRKDTLVRLACQELEAWYLGDPLALADAFGDPALEQLGLKARFRDPDTVAQPSRNSRRASRRSRGRAPWRLDWNWRAPAPAVCKRLPRACGVSRSSW